MMIRYQFRFFGLVQGVGFRFYSQTFAKSFQCTGWVQNLPDGSVLMEIQGDELDIDRVVDSLKSVGHIQIERIEKKELDLKQETTFDYRF